jgi:hypothetical protein
MRQVWRAGIKFCEKNAEIAQGIEKAQIYFSAIAVCGNSIPQFTAKCSNCDMPCGQGGEMDLVRELSA